MILSTQDLDLEKIHKGIFTHDKAKNEVNRLKNRTPDYPQIHSSTALIRSDYIVSHAGMWILEWLY